jgi:hypothetical protein
MLPGGDGILWTNSNFATAGDFLLCAWTQAVLVNAVTTGVPTADPEQQVNPQ